MIRPRTRSTRRSRRARWRAKETRPAAPTGPGARAMTGYFGERFRACWELPLEVMFIFIRCRRSD